ncbi:hypothetical protein AXF42_Ash017863 [Apostasia shenzhenica]|uniref:Uncharacterized protein n=1 Tax=Apostasia shenzhenica TaxID=1088818 RepID=A0A2I0A3Z9_9ASPA|nr:hypothetical protein AXF42_Ash017863 [Apostasia shenzhenica]
MFTVSTVFGVFKVFGVRGLRGLGFTGKPQKPKTLDSRTPVNSSFRIYDGLQGFMGLYDDSRWFTGFSLENPNEPPRTPRIPENPHEAT